MKDCLLSLVAALLFLPVSAGMAYSDSPHAAPQPKPGTLDGPAIVSLGGRDDCSDLVGVLEEHKLPKVADRNRIFACAGIAGLFHDLDELDRDLLFAKAKRNELAVLVEKRTETDPSRRYGDFIPADRLLELKRLAQRYYRPRTSNGSPVADGNEGADEEGSAASDVSVRTIDRDRCLLTEHGADHRLDVPLHALLLEELDTGGGFVRIRTSEDIILRFEAVDDTGPDEYRFRFWPFEVPSAAAAEGMAAALIEAATACGAVDTTAGQEPLTTVEHVTLIGGETSFDFLAVPGQELLLSASCLTPTRKLWCQAYDALKEATTIGMDTSGGRNPGAVICRRVGGWVSIFRDEKGNQMSFCGFDDGSEVSSGSLYARALKNDLAGLDNR